MKTIKMKSILAGPNLSAQPGQVLDVEDQEADELIHGGYAVLVEKQQDGMNDERVKHVGGGYYELPNGQKVRGKDEALKALEELENEGDK